MLRIAFVVCLFSLGCGSDSTDPNSQSAQRIDQHQNAIEQARKDFSGKPATD